MAPPTTITIQPRTGWAPLNLGELWRYRELLYFLVWRDVKVRYKQTALGAAWAIIQPLLHDGGLQRCSSGSWRGIPSDGVPYPVFSFAALVPWTFFANGLAAGRQQPGGQSEPDHEGLLPAPACCPWPRCWPGSSTSRSRFVVLLAMMACYGVAADRQPGLDLPALLLLALVTALGVGLWLSALNVRYRDVALHGALPRADLAVRHAGRLLRAVCSPEPWRVLYALNPMVGVVEGFRWACSAPRPAPGPMLGRLGVAALAAPGRRGSSTSARWNARFADIV